MKAADVVIPSSSLQLQFLTWPQRDECFPSLDARKAVEGVLFEWFCNTLHKHIKVQIT